VLETRHGLLVEALLDAGFAVVPVNPDLVARRRGPARKKDDAEDARICCLLALDRHAALKTLLPHGEIAGELRAIARDDERAARDQRRLLNRLRVDLFATYQAALAIAGDDLAAPTVLRLLERWPTQAELATAGREELTAFARSSRHGWPDRFADKLADALTRPALAPRDYLVRAKAATIRLAATQLLALHEARHAWERRMAELLLGGPRTGRDHTVKDPDPGKALPGGEIYLSSTGHSGNRGVHRRPAYGRWVALGIEPICRVLTKRLCRSPPAPTTTRCTYYDAIKAPGRVTAAELCGERLLAIAWVHTRTTVCTAPGRCGCS
jgi:Transposase